MNSQPEKARKRAPHTLLFLYALNSFLFLWLSFFFLPDSLVKVFGSAAGVALGVFGVKNLSPSEDDAGLSARTRKIFIFILSLTALVQVTFLCIGYLNPCQIWALPGSTIYVDGKFLERTPNLTDAELAPTKSIPSPDNLRPWFTRVPRKHYLRWDTHEIKVFKKWYVDKDQSEEHIDDVWIDYSRLWRKPIELFAHWKMDSGQRLMFTIDYATGNDSAAPGTPANSTPGNQSLSETTVRGLVDDWNTAWTFATDQSEIFGSPGTEPYAGAVRVMQAPTSHLEFEIRDRTGHTLKLLRPIPQPRPNEDISDSISSNIFDQLLAELGIPPDQKIKLPQAVSLGQKLTSEIKVSANSAAPQAQISQTIQQLEDAATSAANSKQFKDAVAVQQQIRSALAEFSTKSVSNPTVVALEASQRKISAAITAQGTKGRIYIHIADESQRDSAKNIASQLASSHFAVVGIQNVGGRAYIPDTAEVRYFAYPEPASTKTSADEITGILLKANVPKARSSYVVPSASDIQQSSDIKTHFEIWFARDSFPQASAK